MKINLIGKKVQMKKKTVIFLTVAVVLFFSIIGYLISSANGISMDIEQPLPKETSAPRSSDAIPDETAKMQVIQVYVTGCVKNPGIYEIEKGQIINDVIDFAGGFTEDANKNINLVYKLYENVTLRVKSKSESHEQSIPSGLEIIHENGVISQSSTPETSQTGGLININTANASQLTALPGIGPSTAAAIVAYREGNGNFQKIEDIMNVSGIKENKFNQIKNYITVN
mgnify:CR=1 FL=1